jgi:hypothetical protein
MPSASAGGWLTALCLDVTKQKVVPDACGPETNAETINNRHQTAEQNENTKTFNKSLENEATYIHLEKDCSKSKTP